MLPSEQAAIRAKCVHPTGRFSEIPASEVDTLVTERFEKIARQYPDSLALKMGDWAATYDAVNRRANRIARGILAGCGDRMSPVIVLADHSPLAIIACLAALKAGKILIPVDPRFPLDRLAFISEDSKAELVLGYGDHLSVAQRLGKPGRAVIDADAIALGQSDENIRVPRSPLDPSGVRYTSGTTGRPKGVVTSHRKRMFQCMVRINNGHICCEDRLIVLRHISMTLTDSIAGLLAGAALFPFDIRGRGLSPLGAFLRDEAISYFVSTPSVYRYFAQTLTEGDAFPALRLIKLGGEPLFRADVETYKKYFSADCILLNQLSGTEMGPVCQYWITKATKITTTIVPVGYPVEDKKVLLLDDEQKQVGMNQVGEIAVASRFLSSGYWNNAGLTNERFVDSEASADESLYLSGDLGRMLADGCLQYVGRKDDQIKIRGVRVEPGEVEAVLLEHPRIRQCVVAAWDRSEGDKVLTAYVVPRGEPAISVSEINDYLRKSLPDYLIPSAFVFLDSLPVSSGKVDRRSLPKPGAQRPHLATPYDAPRDEIEKTLARIWEEVLDVRPIGIHDSFFDLGGHSLAATRVVSRVIQHFRSEIPLQSLFQCPTISAMVAVITAHRGAELGEQRLAAILEEVESLSDEEAARRANEAGREPR